MGEGKDRSGGKPKDSSKRRRRSRSQEAKPQSARASSKKPRKEAEDRPEKKKKHEEASREEIKQDSTHKAAVAEARPELPPAKTIAADAPQSIAGGSSASSCRSDSEEGSKLRRHEGLSGFSTGPAPPMQTPPPTGIVEVHPSPMYAAPSNVPALAVPEKVRGLLVNHETLAMEVARMKMAVEAKTQHPSGTSKESKINEPAETVIRMQPRLHESLLHVDNEPHLLRRTGLLSASVNEDGLLVLRAQSSKALEKALGQLRRVAYHCQWGCNVTKVGALLAEKPAKAHHSIVVRLAATSSRLPSFEARLTYKSPKLRIGTEVGGHGLVVDRIPGISRRHCTITFEPDKGACYVQDLSTNGTYFNGKRLPRPPYKNPQDARVRVFHGDELLFRLRSEDAEELGYVVNLLEFS